MEEAQKEIPKLVEGLTRVDEASAALVKNPDSAGIRGMVVESLGGLLQQAEDMFGVRGAATSQMNVQGVTEARLKARNTLGPLIKEITGDTSGRYSNKDMQFAQEASKIDSTTASTEQVLAAFRIIRDIQARQLLKARKLGGPGAEAMLGALGVDPAKMGEVIGPDGDAPYEDLRFIDGGVYLKMKDGSVKRWRP
jgi:hypothetical protein